MAKKGRANNGMGSIRQRADGRWEARYTTPDGRQKSVYGKSEAEVTKKLRGALHEIDSGAWREPSKMTVGEWLDVWVSDYCTHTAGTTLRKYRGLVESLYKPRIGSIRLSKLMPIHIQRMATQLINDGKSASTVRNYVIILGSALQSAVDAGALKESPTVKVKLPRETKKKLNIVDRESIPAFINASKDTRYPNELCFMIMTGLRLGELRGLKWDDIDLDAGTVHIQRQLHPKGTGKRLTPPKYGEDREIHIPPEAIEILKAQKKRQAEQRLAAGTEWHEDDISAGLVFRLYNGNPHSDTSLHRPISNVGQAIGLPGLHPHDLRHSYAVAALRSGADIKTVQHNLGHKSASMTLDVYAAYTNDAGKEGAKRLSEYLQNIPQ